MSAARRGSAEASGEDARDDKREPAAVVDELDRLLDEEIPGWRPESGSKIKGTVLAVGSAGQESAFGAYPLLTIQRDDGSLVRVHAFHTVLKRELDRTPVAVGDRIGIKYIGLAEGGDFGKFENYRIVVQKKAS